MKFLWIDTETGGLDPTVHSLLSLALVVTEPSGDQVSTEIFFRHPNYTVDPEALAVNHIDLVRHHAHACEPAHAASLIAAFLGRHFPGDEKIQLAGHNVGFDIAFLGVFLRQHFPAIYARFSHRVMDTMPLALALQEAGLLPAGSLGLSALLEHYGIRLEPTLRHTALGDAKATEQLYRCMIADLRTAPL
jgi:DNA polymerase III epsilon subunit-like protein